MGVDNIQQQQQQQQYLLLDWYKRMTSKPISVIRLHVIGDRYPS